MRNRTIILLSFIMLIILCGCPGAKVAARYELANSHPVAGRQGEIEGLTFDKDRGQFLLLYNRGAKIVAGMPTGFYEGYSEEIHEVFVYDIIGGD